MNEQNQLQLTESRPLLKQIDLLPMPNRKKINMQLYFDAWKKHHGQSVVSVSTMRGCPYTCKWCSRAVYGQSYRRKSAKLVVDEMEYLKNTYQADAIWFVDDVFTVSFKWLKEFADEVAARKLVFPYEIITRADRMNEEVIDLLKASGCFRVWIGAESGSQKIIDAMDRRVDVAVVRQMIQLSQKKGIQAGTFIMLGYPGETTADINETIHHLKVSNPDLYTITIAYPIKGTPLYQEVEADLLQVPPEDKFEPIFHFVWGIYHKAKGDFASSKKALEKALALDSSFLPARREISVVASKVQKKSSDSDLTALIGGFFKKR
jgi:radical SAM superfamily enzyme YgiQ (UPF0313 family)